MHYKNTKKVFIIILGVFSMGIVMNKTGAPDSNSSHANNKKLKSQSKEQIHEKVKNNLKKNTQAQQTYIQYIGKVKKNKNSWKNYYAMKTNNNELKGQLHWNFGTQADFEDYYTRHNHKHPMYEHLYAFIQNPKQKNIFESYKNTVLAMSQVNLAINSTWQKHNYIKHQSKKNPDNRKLKNDMRKIQDHANELQHTYHSLYRTHKKLAETMKINAQSLHEPYQIEQYEQYVLGKQLAKKLQKTSQGKELLFQLRQLGLIGVKLNMIGSIEIRLTAIEKLTHAAKQKLEKLTHRWSSKYSSYQNKVSNTFEKLKLSQNEQKAIQNYMEEKGEDSAMQSYIYTAREHPGINKIFKQYAANLDYMRKFLSDVYNTSKDARAQEKHNFKKEFGLSNKEVELYLD